MLPGAKGIQRRNKAIKKVLNLRFSVKTTVVFFLLLATSIFLLNTREITNPPSPFKDWTLHVSEDREHVTFVYSGEEKDLVADVIVDGIQNNRFNFINGKLKLPLKGSPNKKIVNEVKIRKKENGPNGYPLYTIQLARETPEYLKKAYNFTSQYGYIVIQRNTFDLKQTEKNTYLTSATPFIFKDSETDKQHVIELMNNFRPNALNILKSKGNDSDTILSKAILITQFLWSIYSKTGPSDKISHDMSTYQTLLSITEQGGTVQCTGTRDLFINISCITNTGLIIRKFDAF